MNYKQQATEKHVGFRLVADVSPEVPAWSVNPVSFLHASPLLKGCPLTPSGLVQILSIVFLIPSSPSSLLPSFSSSQNYFVYIAIDIWY